MAIRDISDLSEKELADLNAVFGRTYREYKPPIRHSHAIGMWSVAILLQLMFIVPVVLLSGLFLMVTWMLHLR